MHRAWIAAAFILFAYTSQVQSAEPLPPEFHGTGACWICLPVSTGHQRFHAVHPVSQRQSERSFQVEACFSCEGGARYNGIVVWATPTEPRKQSWHSRPTSALANGKGAPLLEVLAPVCSHSSR